MSVTQLGFVSKSWVLVHMHVFYVHEFKFSDKLGCPDFSEIESVAKTTCYAIFKNIYMPGGVAHPDAFVFPQNQEERCL